MSSGGNNSVGQRGPAGPGLPPRVDWHGHEREATAGEVAQAEGTAARVRREVADMRAAAERLASGTAFEVAVATFLQTEATLLERRGAEARYAAVLPWDKDTRAEPGMLPTAARSALLIARAYLAAEPRR
ncbi:hypothetical protein ABZ383_26460 [Streptomyces sp. NPDC005900]|uniref:hypothetical protein n=1 Tax=Streptomyces sp. NPDC005900 TaxID=3154569 RepID=UPI0033DE5E6D